MVNSWSFSQAKASIKAANFLFFFPLSLSLSRSVLFFYLEPSFDCIVNKLAASRGPSAKNTIKLETDADDTRKVKKKLG